MQKKGKLELTWVGKYDEEKPVEPRILLEDPEKSYGDPDSENMLIHGDNLIALQALQQDYAGKIKCIYIDPPFNTGQAFENYDDNEENRPTLCRIDRERYKKTDLRTHGQKDAGRPHCPEGSHRLPQVRQEREEGRTGALR
ncbi:hypothetical protein [Parascardovia denticolens]